MQMPEEINRVLTDRISDLLFTTENSGNVNLKSEGVPGNIVHFVGNVMIDSLVSQIDRARESSILSDLGLQDRKYLLATIHRPSNVDASADLRRTINTLTQVSELMPLLVPLHPRTSANIKRNGWERLIEQNANITTTGPLGYLDFLRCQLGARGILTDSGGIQEESTYLGVPCLTMRANTERPATISNGSNRLIGTETHKVVNAVNELLAGEERSSKRPPLWDGKAAERIATILAEHYQLLP
ncbi:UNVERIFIED_CONTAM: hypothetical protein GTU68_031722 [Idotea baltica]|nr:hypothetical protein [Idotea baltica]